MDSTRSIQLGMLLNMVCLTVLGAGPEPVPYRVVWGDVHGHSALSDGQGGPDSYFASARDVAKLDFVILTDHDFGNRTPWRMPHEDWMLIQDKADEFNDEGRFVAISGYEWTSQEKYWTGATNEVSERLFPGLPRHYNHKNVYFPARVDFLCSAKDPAYFSPDLLAAAVLKLGGLIHNNHPTTGEEGRDQFDYTRAHADVIANTELWADTIYHSGNVYRVCGEETVRSFLNRGGRTGFVGGTDTHEGKPAARTAVLVTELTRAALFDALRHRRNYAVSRARILVDFQINGHFMGEEIQLDGRPRIMVKVQGTAPIDELAVIRDGEVIHMLHPNQENASLTFVDKSLPGPHYYYVRVVQADTDFHGNHSYAWSSPIWITKKP